MGTDCTHTNLDSEFRRGAPKRNLRFHANKSMLDLQPAPPPPTSIVARKSSYDAGRVASKQLARHDRSEDGLFTMKLCIGLLGGRCGS
ncbi:MAG: hypothetical protein K8953_05300 [Proteobacteria bacterium]|nr:hypothetical protein [Pseudomonadota bacterium]